MRSRDTKLGWFYLAVSINGAGRASRSLSARERRLATRSALHCETFSTTNRTISST